MATIQGALVSLRSVMATSPRDWAATSGDAWLYGIIVGWDEAALAELSAKYRWDNIDRARLRGFRAAVEAQFDESLKGHCICQVPAWVDGMCRHCGARK